MALLSRIKAVLQLDTKDFEKGLDKSKKSVTGFNNTLKEVGKTMGIAFAATQIVSFGKEALKAYDIQQKAEAKLLFSLKGRRDVTDRLIEQAQQIQKISLFGDELIIEQQAYLASLRFTEDEMNKVILASVNLSSALGISLDSAVRNLAKTYSGLGGELSELIPQLRDLTMEQMKAGGATKVVNDLFAGQAQIAAGSGTGAIVQLKNAYGDLLEEIGGWIATPGFIEGIKALTEFLQTGSPAAGLEAWARLWAKTGIVPYWIVQGAEWVGLLDDLDNKATETAKSIESIFSGGGKSAGEGAPKPLTGFQVLALPEGNINEIGTKYNELKRLRDAAYDPSIVFQYTTEMERLKILEEDRLKTAVEIVGVNEALAQSTREATEAMAEQLEYGNLLANAITQLAFSIGELAAGGNSEKALGNFVSSMGRLIAGFGASLIAFGIGRQVLESGAPPPVLIAAGLAMAAAGAAMASYGNKISSAAGGYSGGSGYGSYGGGSYGSGGGYTSQREIVLVARGNDLVGVLNAQNYEDNLINP